MTVETDIDRTAFLIDFGVAVTWRGSSFPAIFDRPTTVMPGLSEIDIADRHPTICFPEDTLPLGAAENDPVVVVDEFAVTHSFRCKLIRPDGTGFVVVDLKT
jgi:hypothetical protein